jgi:hypothetical protein
MGIGGLDTEFSAIFRRAFASRIFPPGLVEKLGIQHVKGESEGFEANAHVSRYSTLWSPWYRKDLDGKADRKDAQRS